MSEETMKQSLRDRLQWWLYGKCLAYCVRCIHPDANSDEFSLIDNANFVAISKDEIRELVEEAPEIAWHFDTEAMELTV